MQKHKNLINNLDLRVTSYIIFTKYYFLHHPSIKFIIKRLEYNQWKFA